MAVSKDNKLQSHCVLAPSDFFFRNSKPKLNRFSRLSYSPLDPRSAGQNPAGVDGYFQSVKILSMSSLGSMGGSPGDVGQAKEGLENEL